MRNTTVHSIGDPSSVSEFCRWGESRREKYLMMMRVGDIALQKEQIKGGKIDFGDLKKKRAKK